MWGVVKKIILLSGDKARSVKASILVALIYAIFVALPYMAVYVFFDDSLNNQLTSNTIYKCIIIMIISLIGGSIAKTITYRLQEWASNYVSAKERLDIGDRLKRVPMGFFREKTLGEVTAILTSDLTYYENKAADVLDWVVNGVISSLISCVFLMIFNWRLGMIFTLGFIVSLMILNKMQSKSAEIVPLQKNAETDAISATLEFIRGISVFKLFHMSGNSVNAVKNSYKQYSDISYDLEVKLLPWNTFALCWLKLVISSILLSVPFLASKGIIDVSTAIMMIVASLQIFSPLETLVTSIASIRTMDTVIDRIEKIKSFPMIDEDSEDITLDSFDIVFNNVSFSYDNKNDVVKNISLKIPQNTMTAIVGSSGSGKTTMARLIARFWDVQNGSIEVGGVNIKNLTCDSLLRNISIVFQNVYLFNDTIESNIKYGNPNATHEEVVTASKKACCHDFIMALPDGYDTIVGESGSHLSGGEKQRISIARAILKNAPIVLLDEATSAIDPDNEVAIQQAINELVRDKTLIIIAHRLTTIKEADQIVVMDNGSIVEKGTHNELLRMQGQYSKFWNISQKANQWCAKSE
ncbi:TPA: ABC transporter ATP-binding protein [Clostridioides difficile]|uniref:ABC transporter ATP-binding protein n=1 Tax=Clostridioides difficile TaxID=1496 RepID=UPI00016C60A4|nr:ABC transporter ATP-binding protein [Clostridioides difficile]AXU86759.1 putative ABC transporter ATP-binding/permease [Clostridioides difficile]EGT3641827.1 ABC transporter ATP-binding protein [Clostridioides difficile]EGT3660813.1 ABC transporter ATP-binding protein [Clostridioides difficile]EGT4185029.1 ABC transporter ATP-binding protein [Clostridioides difficile]EGT4215797.1 ABC transporter ATP-binding protein [Clostridioides difficile]